MTAALPNPASPREPSDASGGLRMEARLLNAIPADPLALLPATGPAFAWADPSDGFVVVGAGAAWELVGESCADLARIMATAPRVKRADIGPEVRWTGGFSFDGRQAGLWEGFPPAWLFLPEVLLVLEGSTAWVAAVGPEGADLRAVLDSAEAALGTLRSERTAPRVRSAAEGPSIADRVREALARIATGGVHKVVVSTNRQLTMAEAVDPADVLAAAASAEPTALQFMVRPHGLAAWVGASPERLVRVRGESVVAMALAGTVARGRDATEDAARAKALMASAKDRGEHEVVVDALREALADASVEASAVPRVRRLSRMFHLETEVTATRPQGTGILDLAARLHPTPALAGWPKREAIEMLAEIEPEGRGWYGGAVGWVTPDGDGDFAVGIRGALVNGEVVTGFAGAGVVAESDPHAEEREASLKLDSALAPFGTEPGLAARS